MCGLRGRRSHSLRCALELWVNAQRSGAFDDEDQDRKRNAAIAALVGIHPKDELEAMLSAQLLASHYAAMECYRRAMIREQSFEGRSEALRQATMSELR
jgi:hypothetical protein